MDDYLCYFKIESKTEEQWKMLFGMVKCSKNWYILIHLVEIKIPATYVLYIYYRKYHCSRILWYKMGDQDDIFFIYDMMAMESEYDTVEESTLYIKPNLVSCKLW